MFSLFDWTISLAYNFGKGFYFGVVDEILCKEERAVGKRLGCEPSDNSFDLYMYHDLWPLLEEGKCKEMLEVVDGASKGTAGFLCIGLVKTVLVNACKNSPHVLLKASPFFYI